MRCVITLSMFLAGCTAWIPEKEVRDDAAYAQQRVVCYSAAATRKDLDSCNKNVDNEYSRKIVRSK